MTEQQITDLILNNPFYTRPEFWISVVIGLLSVLYSFIAYREAKAAKIAAKTAGNTVKIQSITIDLTELIQRLDKLSTELDYSQARDFYNELNRRVRRSVSSLSLNEIYKSKTSSIIETLNSIKTNLDEVRQSGSSDSTMLEGFNLYYAIEGEFSNLSGQLADLCGLLEQKTIEQ
jgi:hypothetical protein